MTAAFGTDVDDLKPVNFISAAIGGQTALIVRSEETDQGTLDIHWTEEQDAMFWLIEDKIYVHPDRWDLFMSMMSERVL